MFIFYLNFILFKAFTIPNNGPKNELYKIKPTNPSKKSTTFITDIFLLFFICFTRYNLLKGI